MTATGGRWTATIAVRPSRPTLADWIERSLRPEVTREVPRTRALLRRPGPRTVEVVIEAKDAGAMRAALNTYLGWVRLAAATVQAAAPEPGRAGRGR